MRSIIFDVMRGHSTSVFFFFNDTATTEIYTLSLHDALPICADPWCRLEGRHDAGARRPLTPVLQQQKRSEEHTSELQSRLHLVCRLLLEKKKHTRYPTRTSGSRRNHPSHARLCHLCQIPAHL